MVESNAHPVSVLLVEDETLIRMMIAGMIEELGHTVVAEAGNITDALRLANTVDFEIAVLDINLGGDRIEPVAEIIDSRRVPFIFASGYGAAGLPEKIPRPTHFAKAIYDRQAWRCYRSSFSNRTISPGLPSSSTWSAHAR